MFWSQNNKCIYAYFLTQFSINSHTSEASWSIYASKTSWQITLWDSKLSAPKWNQYDLLGVLNVKIVWDWNARANHLLKTLPLQATACRHLSGVELKTRDVDVRRFMWPMIAQSSWQNWEMLHRWAPKITKSHLACEDHSVNVFAMRNFLWRPTASRSECKVHVFFVDLDLLWCLFQTGDALERFGESKTMLLLRLFVRYLLSARGAHEPRCSCVVCATGASCSSETAPFDSGR